MKKTIITFPKNAVLFALFATVLVVGCSSSLKGVPYSGGDVCKWAKQNLAVMQQQYNELIIPPGTALSKLRSAQGTVVASCHTEEEDGGAWACAEGHSCK